MGCGGSTNKKASLQAVGVNEPTPIKSTRASYHTDKTTPVNTPQRPVPQSPDARNVIVQPIRSTSPIIMQSTHPTTPKEPPFSLRVPVTSAASSTLHTLENDLESLRSSYESVVLSRGTGTQQARVTYEELLTQLLLKVDGVDTNCDGEVRSQRKQLVKSIQTALDRVDQASMGSDSLGTTGFHLPTASFGSSGGGASNTFTSSITSQHNTPDTPNQEEGSITPMGTGVHHTTDPTGAHSHLPVYSLGGSQHSHTAIPGSTVNQPFMVTAVADV